MGPLEREAAQRRGRRKLDAMRRRAGELRRRVVATAIVAFVLLWTAVFVQMATGNDPALGTGAPAGSAAEKERAMKLERRQLQSERAAAASAEVERSEAERAEAEQRQAEARELEELEAITTGQS